MTAAEIMLRIGASLGGWLIFVAHALTLVILIQAQALDRVGTDGSLGSLEWNFVSDAQMRGTALLGALAACGLVGVGLGMPFRAGIRWLAGCGLGLALWAAWSIAPALRQPTHEGLRLWALFQLAVLVGGVLQAARYLRPLPSGQSIRRRSGDT